MTSPVEILYQYATDQAYPAAAGWTSDRSIEVQTARDGIGQVVGSAVAGKIYGKVRRPGGTVGDEPMPTVEPSLGRWVRLLYKDAGGSVSYDGDLWAPFWHGYCAATRRSIGGGDGSTFPGTGVTTYECRGMADAMRQVLCITGWSYYNSGINALNFAPTFNDRYGRGQPTSAAQTINGASVYIFDAAATQPDVDRKWTLDQALAYLIATYTNVLIDEAGSSGSWGYISAAVKASYKDTVIPEYNPHGKPLLQAVSELVALVRGVTFYVDVLSDVPTLVLYPATEDAAQTPANLAVNLDLRSDIEIESAIIHEDTTEACDELTILGNRPINTAVITYGTSGTHALEPDGWTTAATPNETDPQDFSWRRYRLRDAITSAVGDYFRNALNNPATGYDGDRAEGSPYSNLRDLELTSKMGWPSRSTLTGNMSMDDRRNACVFFKATTAGYWEDVTDKAQLRIDGKSGRLTLSPALALRMWAGQSAGAEIQITTGILEPAPLKVSVRATAAMRGQRQRIVPVSGAGFDQCWHDSGIPYAVNQSTGALTSTSVAAFTHDSVTDMTAAVDAQSDEFVRNASVSVGWRKRALEWTTYPGYRVATVIIGAGTITTDCLISARTWTFAERGLSTTYETMRVVKGQVIS